MLPPLIDILRESLRKEVIRLFPAVDFDPATLTPATHERFGHYQYNGALALARPLARPPREIAQAIMGAWRENLPPCIGEISLAGAGFVNITLSSQYLGESLPGRILHPPMTLHPKKIIVEFSSPNIAKELHVGHLRSTVIGESLARLMEGFGHEVVRLNHVGDWGTQFGMMIAHMQDRHPPLHPQSAGAMMALYREAKERFDSDSDFKRRAHEAVVSLQGKEPRVLAQWEEICALSRLEFEALYRRLNVSLLERGESAYADLLPGVIADAESKGLVTLSDGAKCLFMEGFKTQEGDPLPLIIQKRDGGYNYATTDLAAIKQRVFEEEAEEILYVVDGGQRLHFAMVFSAARALGYLPDGGCLAEHVPFGVVVGQDGKKFRTRSGKTERLSDLLDEGKRRASALLMDREIEDREGTAEILAMNAIKYADLSSPRTQDYRFSYDHMLSFEGNTATYLLYSYVRIEGIKRRGGEMEPAPLRLEHPSEVSLALALHQMDEALLLAIEERAPHRLAESLHQIAGRFHAFFRDCPVMGSPQEASRRWLCKLTQEALARGFTLLGLEVVTSM
ncbi:MAG: arginine--tRNA ligase [Chlamydiota bacterium]|nr:arginine--tRNA ligase [Chlamydiota bacterium]